MLKISIIKKDETRNITACCNNKTIIKVKDQDLSKQFLKFFI